MSGSAEKKYVKPFTDPSPPSCVGIYAYACVCVCRVGQLGAITTDGIASHIPLSHLPAAALS